MESPVWIGKCIISIGKPIGSLLFLKGYEKTGELKAASDRNNSIPPGIQFHAETVYPKINIYILARILKEQLSWNCVHILNYSARKSCLPEAFPRKSAANEGLYD